MKILKYILIGILCLILVICLLGLILPKEYTVARSAVVKAPKKVVLAHVKSLETMDKWSPWSKKDPNMKKEFGGNDGEVGSWTTWEGNSDVGKGKQEVTAVTDNSVDLKLTFIEPWETVSNVNFTVADTADASKVTWTMKGKMPFPFNVFGLFMNMDKMIGSDFEKGLAGMKTMAEAAAHKTYRGYEIKEINFAPKVYVTKRATVKFSEIGPFFGKSIPALFQATGKAGLQPTGAPSAIYYKWDTEKQQTDMAVAIPFANGTTIPDMKGMEKVKAEGKALQITHHGAYDKLATAYGAMDDYMKEKNFTLNELIIEEYITGPQTEKDTAKWQTNVYYLLK